MFRNYLSAALRNLLRNRAVTLINIIGLAVGFAAALLIGLYVRYEHSYEDFIPGHERVYRITQSWAREGGNRDEQETVAHQMSGWLALDFPEIEYAARLLEEWHSVGAGDREFNEQTFAADPDFFRIIPLKGVAGDLTHSLDAPDGIAISRSMARKYFGRDNPLGKVLKYERFQPLRVTAVFEDLPGNSHFNFRLVASAKASGLKFMEGHSPEDRAFLPVHTYLRLKPGADIQNIRTRMPEFTEKHWSKEFASGVKARLLPIADIHLSPDAHAAFKPRGNPSALVALTLVAVLIVFVAVVNFVNLTTARAAQRGIEVGVRKLAGARRRDLALQFIGESLIYVTIAMLLAMSLVEIALPGFRALIDPGVERYAPPSIAFNYWREPALLAALAGVTLLVGLIAAAYPAAVLSAFRPAMVLKGAALQGGGGARVRQWLVVLQFATLIGLTFATAVIYRQTRYALNSALRIDTNQVVIYNLGMEMQGAAPPAPAFVAAVERTPGVLGVTRSMSTPTSSTVISNWFSVAGGSGTLIKLEPVDYNFFDFYRVPLLAGRAFSRQRANDQFVLAESTRPVSVIVNEAAARKLGFAKLAGLPGKELKVSWAQPGVAPPQSITVIGVVGDFPIDSIRREIEPTLYFVFETPLTMLHIRVAGQHIPETLRALNDAWKKVGQPRAQEGWLLDGYYRTLYADIILQQKTLSLFAGCAVFLAALGLFGLSIYTAQRRTKEIGIRKVMGASTGDVMRLLLWAFTKPVLWASLIAWPLAAWLMTRWLEGFAYRVPLGWWWLPVATLAALGIALATVSAHSYAVARQQPAGALRYE